MKTQQEIEQLAEQYLWGKIFLTKKDKYQTEIAYMSGYKQCQQDIDKQLKKAIEYGAEEMYSRKDLVDFVYFLNDRHFNKYTVDTDEVDLFIEQFKKK